MRDDEERAFEEFVGRSADRLLLSAVLLVGGDRAAGEDLLQGAFERTYRHWPKVSEGHPEAYVRRALVNGATSRWRRLRARVAEVPLVTEGRPGSPEVPVADHAEALSLRDGLVRALRTLPPRQRAVIVLRYLDDLSESDVAAALGCSVGSVRSQASRGLARLRENSHLLDGPSTVRAAPRVPAGVPDVLTNESDAEADAEIVLVRAVPDVAVPVPGARAARLRPVAGGRHGGQRAPAGASPDVVAAREARQEKGNAR
ncbi:SigE family RNA polymerase sigma factor [Frankia nepalensis]|uniref:SigE family RNA polymerase sigma factor n=1 Tax=Frankia nepalensis TaxID=1836974 RepID=UPI0027DDCA5E|nr:SigE family RNA polymerase sigma factor [Frankia nepalensis]